MTVRYTCNTKQPNKDEGLNPPDREHAGQFQAGQSAAGRGLARLAEPLDPGCVPVRFW